MSTLYGNNISQTYQGLIKLTDSTTGVTSVTQSLQDGLGNNLPIQLSTNVVNISGSLLVNGLPVSIETGSFATTGSNTFIGNQTITGSVNISGSQRNIGNVTITGSLGVTNIKGTGSLYLQPNQGDARFIEIYNTSPTDTHITASGGQIFMGDDVTYVKVDNYGSVERIDIVAGNELVVSSSITNLTGSLYQSGTFYPDVIDWVNSSIVQNTGSYILTVNTQGITEYDTYANVASALQPFINTGSFNRDGLITTGSAAGTITQSITGSLNVSGNITANSASFNYLETIYETASIIYSSGSNQFGDASNDTQTLWGKINIPTGPISLSGSLFVSGGQVIVGNPIGNDYINNGANPSVALQYNNLVGIAIILVHNTMKPFFNSFS
jgi:hypothetical protein